MEKHEIRSCGARNGECAFKTSGTAKDEHVLAYLCIFTCLETQFICMCLHVYTVRYVVKVMGMFWGSIDASRYSKRV